jgi:Protein of unknown function (DUF2905)
VLAAREFGRMLLVLGAFICVVGAFFFFGGKLPFRLGRLPGDIYYQGKNSSFYFPVVTCLLLSVALTVIFWVIGHFRR